MMMKCPNCSAEVEFIEGESEICCECGKELKPAETPAEKNEKQVAKVDFFDMLNSIRRKKKETENEWDLSAKSKEMADNIDSAELGESPKSECKHLKVEFNRNVFFLSGSEAIISLKMTPLDSNLQKLLLFMETLRDGSNTRREIVVREVLRKDRTFYVQIPFNPGKSFGRILQTFYVGCKVNNKFSYYQFALEHKVYDSNQSGSSLFQQLVINQQISASEAADVHYRDSVGEALKEMNNKHLSVNEMIDKLNDLPPDYRQQLLTATTWSPEEILVRGNLFPAEKLLLEYNGKKIFLFNKSKIFLGRTREKSDLLVRCGGGSMSPREYPNSTVSGLHAVIEYHADKVTLQDHSSYGTYVNEKKIAGENFILPENGIVEFGDIHWKMSIQQCGMRLAHNICQTCPGNKVKSLTFKRKDHEPEYYLFVWQCCELGLIIEELANWTIFTRNGYFFIRTPEQEFYHLRPSPDPIRAKEQTITIKYFQQD